MTTAATLSALAQIDSGSLKVMLGEVLYPEALVQDFIASHKPEHCRVACSRSQGQLWLELTATDRGTARLQIGNALSDLLRHVLAQPR